MSNQKKLIVIVITLSLILIISSSYALLRSTKVSGNNYSISIGDLEVTFLDNQTEALNLDNMYPMSDEEGESQEKTLTFTVENTGTVGTYYDVYIEELSTNPEFKSVIRFISKKDEEEYKEPKTLSENKYIEITGYLEPKQTSTYKVKVWLAEEADNTYMKKEFKAKIVVKAYQESSYAKDIIKSKLVKYEKSSKEDFQGGLVGVNTNGELYNETDETQTIREYRYSGLGVKNYVTFNNETWKIIGIFKDEAGEEHVKIVRNEVLSADLMPDTYEVEGKNFNIRYNSSKSAYYDWDGGSYDNNWADAGLMYWLNSKGETVGYLQSLTSSAQKMTAETKYFLGTLTYDSTYNVIKDTSVEAYNYERATDCSGGKGPSENSSESAVIGNSRCRVWANNKATWIGKIALMYPSDYGFSTDSSYWNMNLGSDFNSYRNSSWLYKETNHLENIEWLLSSSSIGNKYVIDWHSIGNIGHFPSNSNLVTVRPTLYLKSDVKIVDGDGSINNQYKLSID